MPFTYMKKRNIAETSFEVAMEILQEMYEMDMFSRGQGYVVPNHLIKKTITASGIGGDARTHKKYLVMWWDFGYIIPWPNGAGLKSESLFRVENWEILNFNPFSKTTLEAFNGSETTESQDGEGAREGAVESQDADCRGPRRARGEGDASLGRSSRPRIATCRPVHGGIVRGCETRDEESIPDDPGGPPRVPAQGPGRHEQEVM